MCTYKNTATRLNARDGSVSASILANMPSMGTSARRSTDIAAPVLAVCLMYTIWTRPGPNANETCLPMFKLFDLPVTPATIYWMGLALCLLFQASRGVSYRASTGTWRPRRSLTPDDWSNHIAVVSGGCGGLGSELCRQLVQRGCSEVYALDRRPFQSHDLGDTKNRERPKWLPCDLADAASIASAVARLPPSKPVLLFLNAATHSLEPLAHQSPADIVAAVNVNVTSTLLLLHHLSHRTTHTLIVSSVMGVIGVKEMEVYVSSKFALVGLYESLRRSASNVSLVLPSHISTTLFQHWRYPFPFNYLVPTLSPEYVASKCIEEVHSRQSRRLYLPRTTVALEMLTLSWVPGWAKELALWSSGSDDAVRHMRASQE